MLHVMQHVMLHAVCMHTACIQVPMNTIIHWYKNNELFIHYDNLTLSQPSISLAMTSQLHHYIL